MDELLGSPVASMSHVRTCRSHPTDIQTVTKQYSLRRRPGALDRLRALMIRGVSLATGDFAAHWAMPSAPVPWITPVIAQRDTSAPSHLKLFVNRR
jgi:hypothetical protein